MMGIQHSNNSEVSSFNFGGMSLRALLVDGEPWFIAQDVANMLGYRDSYNLTRRLDEDEKGTHSVSTPGGVQDMTIISESGMYVAILGSQIDGAKAFKKWVTSDVLPAIRKTGEYATPKTLEERSLALIGELSQVVENQRLELESARPKVETYDKVLTPDHTFNFRALCKTLREHYPINENDVKRILREKKILTPGFRLDVYSKAITDG